MEVTFAILFIAIAIVIMIVDLYFAARSYRELTVAGRYLGRAAVLAVLVTASYLASIILTDYFAASLMTSIYFVCIDWMLLTLLQFVIILSIRVPLEKDIPLMWVLRFCAVADSIILMINPFREIAIHYVSNDSIIAHYTYEKHLLYNLHLAFTYLLVLAVIGILVRRITKTPQRYRNQYMYIVAAILLIVAVNAVFIIPEKASVYTMLDYSIIGYSVALLLMYWSCFSYSRTYLLEGLSKTVFDNVSQGLILFDYMGFLVMYNHRLQEILPQIRLQRNMPIADFLPQCQIPPEKIDEETTYTMQSFTQKADAYLPVRCEYRKLLDEDGTVNGYLFVFSDDSQEMDLLTGFHGWDHFRRYVHNHSEAFVAPYAVAVFDINALANINRRLGKDTGDHRIHELAEIIREKMPADSYFVRGYDANLIAISRGMGESELKDYAARVVKAGQGRVQVGLSEPADEYENILKVINRAGRSMTIRKLLDPGAFRSQSLASLVRALKESDSDTEAHVERTQTMGQELGHRLGLNDLQMSQLSLLCLLHDIGKVGVPLEILNKPGRLNGEEWAVMQTHVEKGYQIAVSSRALQDIAEMIRAHHERWDGNGYLHRMKGTEIPLLSRIIAVVDSYDAMVNDRVYRAALPVEKAKEEIRRGSGTQFDPAIAEVFLQMLEEKPWIAEGVFTDGSTVSAALYVRTMTGAPGIVAGVPLEAAASVNEEPMQDVEVPLAADVLMGAPAVGSTMDEIPAEMLRRPSDARAPEKEKEKETRSYAVKYSRYQLDVDDQIIDVDDNFEDLTGYTKKDVWDLRLKQSDLIDESDRLDYYMNVDAQMGHGDIIYIEHDIVRKDGGIVHVYCCGRRYFDSASKSIRSEIIIVDATSTHHGRVKVKQE